MDQLEWSKLDDIAPHLDFEGYFFYGVVGVLYFMIQHFVLHLVIKVCYPGYSKMELRDMNEYRCQHNALWHSVLASIWAVYCMYGTCPDGQTFYNNQECRETVRNSHVWLCFFTASYLLVDTFTILFVTGISTSIDKQTLVHHLIGFSNYYLAMWQQDFAVTQGAIFIFLEVSTPFVCLRWLFFHHGMKGSLTQTINTLLLLVFFIFGRVFLQAYCIWMYDIDWISNMWFHKEGVSTVYKIVLVEMSAALVTNVVLNFFWSWLIIRQVLRIITRGQQADADYAGDKDTSVEDNEAGRGAGQADKKKRTGNVEMEDKKLVDPKQPQSDQHQA